MILAILFKVIPWYYGIVLSQDAVYQFAFFSGFELFVEIVFTVGVIGALYQGRQAKKGG